MDEMESGFRLGVLDYLIRALRIIGGGLFMGGCRNVVHLESTVIYCSTLYYSSLSHQHAFFRVWGVGIKV